MTPDEAAFYGPKIDVKLVDALGRKWQLSTVQFDWNLTPAYDVIARLPGGELSDEWVIRGNHHDAWVFGGSDPLSGLVPMMEEARGVAALAKGGWKPRRCTVLLPVRDRAPIVRP